MACEYRKEFTLQMGTISLSSSHKLINLNDQNLYVQYVITNIDKGLDAKLLAKYKTTLMAK